MAHVGEPGPEEQASGFDDRGQLILIGGVVVALGLVALVLLLNTALFTENIATRGLGADHERADAHRAFGAQAAERTLRDEEHIEYADWLEAKENTSYNIQVIDSVVQERQFQQHGARARLQLSSVSRGAVLTQDNQSRNFTAGGTDDSSSDWMLANTTGIRNFTMTLNASSLNSQTEAGNFTVVINNGQWAAEIYESSGVVEIRVHGQTCTSNASIATVNWTEGNLDGCSFPFAVDSSGDTLTAPYRLEFLNGSNASGTYHVVVRNRGGTAVFSENFDSAGSTGNPRMYDAVYAVVLEVIYDGSTTTYQTHVRTAPGEANATRPPE